MDKERKTHKKGMTVIELMIGVATMAILAGIAIPGTLAAKATANETNARVTLKTYAKAFEFFMLDNGRYPVNEAELTSGAHPYLCNSINNSSKGGYSYSMSCAAIGYAILASADTNLSGRWDYQIIPGQKLYRRSNTSEGEGSWEEVL